MNLNKFTKAELISKLKNNESKNSNKQSLWISFMEFILTFKKWIINITLIALLAKVFKKYKFINFILRFFNWIIITIFGISLFDHLNVLSITKEIRYILSGIVGYLSETQFYSLVANLFGSKEITAKTASTTSEHRRTVIEGIGRETKTSEDSIRENQANSRKTIQEWLKPEPEPEVIKNSDNSKYYIIAGLIILTCVGWYYSDEIKTFGLAALEWYRRRPDNGGDGNINQTSFKNKIKNIFYKDKNDTSDTSNASSPIASSSNIPIKIENTVESSEAFDEYIQKPKKSVRFLTDHKENENRLFDAKLDQIDAEINQFNITNENEGFPNLKLQKAIYNTTLSKLKDLSLNHNEKYTDLIQNSQYFNNKFSKFLDLTQEDWYKEEKYNEVEQMANQEKDVWSDNGSNNSGSPKSNTVEVTESISQVFEKAPSPITTEAPSSPIADAPIPPAPPAPPIPSTSQGAPSTLLEQIQLGKKLKKVEQTEIKPKTDTETGIFKSLKNVFIKAIDDEDNILTDNKWDDEDDSNNNTKIDKGKSKEIIKDNDSSSDSEESGTASPGMVSYAADSVKEGETYNYKPDHWKDIDHKKEFTKIEEKRIEQAKLSELKEDLSNTVTVNPPLDPNKVHEIMSAIRAQSYTDSRISFENYSKWIKNNNEAITAQILKSNYSDKKGIMKIAEEITKQYLDSLTSVSKIESNFASTSNQFEDSLNLFNDNESEKETSQLKSIETISDNTIKNPEDLEKLFPDANTRIQEMVESNYELTSVELISLIQQEIPEYNQELHQEYFRRATEHHVLNELKTDRSRLKYMRRMIKDDLKDRAELSKNISIENIRNVINENYTSNVLLHEIKSKTLGKFKED